MDKEYQDITIVCQDCGQEFVFTANEQIFYKEKGLQNQPKRCKECRQKRKLNKANKMETGEYIINNNAESKREF